MRVEVLIVPNAWSHGPFSLRERRRLFSGAEPEGVVRLEASSPVPRPPMSGSSDRWLPDMFHMLIRSNVTHEFDFHLAPYGSIWPRMAPYGPCPPYGSVVNYGGGVVTTFWARVFPRSPKHHQSFQFGKGHHSRSPNLPFAQHTSAASADETCAGKF